MNALDNFMPAHRCEACGCKAGDHKGGTDENGPEGTCPSTRSWGHPGHGPWHAADDATWAKYWATGKMFAPRA